MRYTGTPGAVRDKISATVPWSIFAGKNSEILTKIDDFSSYVEVAKLTKVVYMRTDAPRKWSKVQPRALNGLRFMDKNSNLRPEPMHFRERLKTESVILTPPHDRIDIVSYRLEMVRVDLFCCCLTIRYDTRCSF